MKWRQPANRNVVDAVIAAFRDPASSLRERLSTLTLKQWERSYYWLDANGLALYFLKRLESLHLTHALPAEVLKRLQQNLADSGERVASMSAEFTALNHLFQNANISYTNLKGFTLAPDSVPDLKLRCQLDFDFLVDGKDVQRCRELLEARGYSVRGQGRNVLEFKTDCSEMQHIANLYKPAPQRCVEIHFAADVHGNPARDPHLDHLRLLERDGLSFPSLSSVDQFVGQATHLYTHLCGAHTRVAWLLEFLQHMRTRAEDQNFWLDVRACAKANKHARLSLGIATLLLVELFGFDSLPTVARWMCHTVPGEVLAWISQYGVRAVLADTPGTKLGSLLQDAVHHNDPAWQNRKRAAFIPRHRAPRILPLGKDASLRKRIAAEGWQLRYDLFRLRFHLVEGLRYRYESFRFQRLLAQRRATAPTRTPIAYLTESR